MSYEHDEQLQAQCIKHTQTNNSLKIPAIITFRKFLELDPTFFSICPTQTQDSSHQGFQIWHQIGSDWPQMGQIWDFLKSVSVHFGTETDLKKSKICPIWGQSDPI